jgi:surface polysaccharide O-acyltransferase-like enzyme
MNMPSLSQRQTWIDFTRVLATFLVVMAHVVLYPQIMGAGPVWSRTFYYTLTRIAVPLFFFISGYLLLSKVEDWGVFFKKRVLKVLIPFLIWSIVYMSVLNHEYPNGLTFQAVIVTFDKILRGPRAAHLWFFYVLIGLYLFTPVLRVFTAHASQRELLYFCVLWFIVNPIFALIEHFTSIKIGFEFEFITGYIGYYVAGLYFGRIELTRKRLVVFGVAFLVAFIFTFLAIYIGQHQPKYDQFFEDYLSFNVAIMSISAFMLLRKVHLPEKTLPFILPLSSATLGIYLVHILALEYFNNVLAVYVPFMRLSSSIFIMPLTSIIVFLACFVFVFALQKIPILKYVVP